MRRKAPSRKRYHCFYCGVIVRARRTIDHIKPKCRGGAHLGANNRVVACYQCNQEKGWRNLEEYRTLCEERTGGPVMFFGEGRAVQGDSFMFVPEQVVTSGQEEA